MNWIAPLLMGFAGSFHCVGMCGPIALAVGSKKVSNRFLINRMLYNLGRVVTYSILGLLLGVFGSTMNYAGWQQMISVLAGIFILLFASSTFRPSKFSNINFLSAKIYSSLKTMFSSLLKKESSVKWFSLGVVNGILPCGFVYLALGVAVLQTGIVNVVLFMSLFGLATIPAMLALTLAGGFINSKWKFRFNKLAPYIASLVAVLLILRGLNLGIPYLSPQIIHEHSNEVMMECCKVK